MKINNDTKKIVDYNSFSIINDEDILIKKRGIDLCRDLLKYNIKDIYYDDNTINNIYDNITKDMDSVFNYYYNMQDKIEEMLYPNESFYILIVNISKIYRLVDMGRFFIDRWYDTKEKTIRKVYDIQFDKCRLNDIQYKYIVSVIVDKYYNNDFFIDEIEEINLYDYELYNFLGIISIIPKISGVNKNEVIYLIDYVDKTYSYMLKKYEEYQKKNEDDFAEKNNDVEFSSNE